MTHLAALSGTVAVVARKRRDRLGEGPLWSPRDGALYWTDILGQRLNRLSLDDGKVDEWSMPEMIGWIIERGDARGFIVGLQSGIKTLSLEPMAIGDLVSFPDEPRDNRLNDAKADSHGCLWVGTMPVTCDRPTGNLYRVNRDATVTLVDSGYTVANGPAISPDGRWLFHTDSGLGNIYRFPLNDDGTLGARDIFVTFEPGWGSPDGMTFDADGGLWVAHWGAGRVSRFDPQGQVERATTLPASQITSMAFAGERLDRMFVTSAADGVDEALAGALFEIDPGCRGLAPSTFRNTQTDIAGDGS